MPARFFYGWVVIAVAFVTMGIGVNARTAFSLLYAPILDEFGWERGLTAGAFSVGFFVSAVVSPFMGALMDRWGPRGVILLGVLFVGGGMALAPLVHAPWHLYLTLGLCVSGGSLALGYLFVVLIPLNLLQRQRPEAMGLYPDGDRFPVPTGGAHPANVVDPAWASIDWTLALAIRTARFWWIALAYVTGLFAWYAVQVHQTKYLIEIGFEPARAAYALRLVGFMGIAGYGLASIYGAIPAEIFQGRQYSTIFATLSVGSTMGAGLGPWVAGVLYDRTGSYVLAFWIAIACSVVSAGAVWLASPGRVRTVAGRTPRAAGVSG